MKSGLAEEETYTYYIDDLQQGVATTEKTKTYTGLQASTEYTIKVVVKDKFGNTAEETAQVRTTDPAVPDMGDASQIQTKTDQNIQLQQQYKMI